REQRLVDVHEPHALLAQPRVEIGLVPALVADLDDEGELPERVHQVGKPLAVPFLVLEGPGELDQERVELVRAQERPEPVPHRADLRPGPDLIPLVREPAPEFGRVAEVVQVLHTLRPPLRDLRPDRTVEGRIDLDQIQEPCKVADGIEALRLLLRVDDALPVAVIPPRDADPDRRPAHGASIRARISRTSWSVIWGKFRYDRLIAKNGSRVVTRTTSSATCLSLSQAARGAVGTATTMRAGLRCRSASTAARSVDPVAIPSSTRITVRPATLGCRRSPRYAA